MDFRSIIFDELDASYRAAIESWASLIPSKFPCTLGTYDECDVVGDVNGGLTGINYAMPIGFVLSGRLEICESYEFLEMTAYRPIRLLSPGDLFGDFSFLDAALGCNGTARRAETWKIHSGARSVLITQKIGRYEEHYITEAGTTKPHLILPRILQEGAKVLFIDGEKLREHGACLVAPLLRHSWAKAKIYRDCLNSFNFNELLLFKERAYRFHEDLTSRGRQGGGREYTRAISKDAILDVFLDAVWDACNRPLRNEPLFETPIISTDIEKLRVTGIKPNNIYLASTSWDTDNPLLFPVDSHNFLIGAYAKAASENPSRIRRDSIRKNIEKVFQKQIKQRFSNEKPANVFYTDLANLLIASEILPQYSDYPYNVECKEIQGTHSRMMILEFTKKRRS